VSATKVARRSFTEHRAEIVEEINDGNDAERERAPLYRFPQHMFGGGTQNASLPIRLILRASAAQGQEIARELIGPEAV